MEEGDVVARFLFVEDVRLALLMIAKTCSHRSQAFKEVNNGQAFPQETIFFLNELIAGTPRYVCNFSSRKDSNI